MPQKTHSSDAVCAGKTLKWWLKDHWAVATLVAGAAFLWSPTAHAIPAFAAQTGMPCSACHVGFPELTPFGREFKLEGYIAGGMFPSLKNFAVMQQSGFTSVHDKVAGGLAPGFKSNDTWDPTQTSVFYGGALDEHIGLGAFAQVTYDGAAHQWHWDNTDIRMAKRFNVFGKPLFWGITVNNAPTVTDLWNDTPAWGYPYISSSVAPAPAASSQITSLGGAVYGIGTYGAMNITLSNMIYAEADLYKTLPDHLSYALGVGPAPRAAGVIPYLRLSFQHQWGNSSIQVGSYGLFDQLYPPGDTSGQTDRYLDVGADSQLQYITSHQAFSFMADFLHESQDYRASYPMGLVSSPSDTLDILKLTVAELIYQKFQITESFKTIYGTPDKLLYSAGGVGGSLTGKPNTNSWTTEFDYYPFNNGGPGWLPWLNMKFFVIALAVFMMAFASSSKPWSARPM